jgi:hypothetical protein
MNQAVMFGYQREMAFGMACLLNSDFCHGYFYLKSFPQA